MSRTTACSMFVLAVLLSGPAAAQLSWEQVAGSAAGTAAGFGDGNNRVALSGAVFDGSLYIGTYNEITGAEVWSSSNGTTWGQVNTDNFGQNLVDHINYGAYSMGVFLTDLYAGTWGGFIAADDTRMFRTSTGTGWTQTNLDGFGDSDNAEPLTLVVFKGMVYVGIVNYPDGAEVMLSHNGANWTQANSNGFGDGHNAEISAMATDGATLYAATGNTTTGCEIWATTTGLDWDQVNTDGFGSASNESAYSMAVFDGVLFVVTTNTVGGLQVWRYSSSGPIPWIRVATSGFGDTGNVAGQAIAVHNGGLYVGTYNAGGAEVWRSQDGLGWSQVNLNGFGSAPNYSVASLTDFNGRLYAGTARGSALEVWRVAGPFFADGFESGATSAWSVP